jgi:hypothetical protein
MKRMFVLFVLGMFLISMVGFVSAGPLTEINKLIDGTVSFFQETKLVPAILGDTPKGDLLFAKFLFFAIILSIVFLALKRVPLFEENVWVVWVVSIAASILSIRFIKSDGIIQSILLPYTTLGIAISAAIPFVIYFIVVEMGMPGRRYKTFRKIAWIFFAVIFIGLWISRLEIDKIQSNAIYMYPITAALALLMLKMDGTIQRWQARMRTEKATSHRHLEAIYKLEDLITVKTKRFAEGRYEGHGGKTQYEKEVKKLKDRIATLEGS